MLWHEKGSGRPVSRNPPPLGRNGFRASAAILAAVVAVSWIGPSMAHAQEPEPGETPANAIVWLTDLSEAMEQSRLTRLPLVVDWGAMWCRGCRKFLDETEPSPLVREYTRRLIWVRIDIDRNVSLARQHDVRGTPRFDLVDPQGMTRMRIQGFLPPEKFRQRLQEFLRDLLEHPGAAPPDVVSEIPGDVRTPLTWTPDGFRGLAICFSHVGYGPLNLPSQSPFQSLRSAFQPRTPSTLAEGHVNLRHTETWVNIWARGTNHLLDYEMLRSDFAVAYGVSDTIQLEFEAVDKSRFGGVMDGFVQGFHDTFNIDQGGRDEVRKRDFSFEIDNPREGSKVSLSGDDRGSFSREFLLTFQHNITCGTEDSPALAYALTLRADQDIAGDLDGGSPVDVALSVSASKRFGDIYGYLGVGFAWFGKEEFRGIELESTQASVLAAIEWRFSAGMSFVVQYLSSQEVTDHLGPFSEPSHEVTLGWKGELWQSAVLEIGVVENVLLSDNSPDFGIHAGLTYRF